MAKHANRLLVFKWQRRFRKRVHWLIYEAPPGLSEFISGVMLGLWGVWLIVVPDVFEASKAYDIFEVAPQRVWGVFAFWIGFWQAAATLIGTTVLRRILCWFASMFWILVAISFFLSSPSTTAIPTYTMIAIMNMWMHFRLGRAVKGLDGDGF